MVIIMANEEIKGLKDYQYGFADKDTSIYKTKMKFSIRQWCQDRKKQTGFTFLP